MTSNWQPLRLRTNAKSAWKDAFSGEAQSGAMVALLLPFGISTSLRQRVQQKGINPVPDRLLHLTLAYIGQVGGLSLDREVFLAAVRSFARRAKPLRGDISGAGRFATRDGLSHPVYYSYDSPDLPSFRQGVVDCLQLAGFAVDMSHGFTPHITVAYIGSTDRTPDLTPARPIPLTFGQIGVVWQDNYILLPLGVETAKAAPPRPAAAAPLRPDVQETKHYRLHKRPDGVGVVSVQRRQAIYTMPTAQHARKLLSDLARRGVVLSDETRAWCQSAKSSALPGKAVTLPPDRPYRTAYVAAVEKDGVTVICAEQQYNEALFPHQQAQPSLRDYVTKLEKQGFIRRD